jgi:hypothetical protein
MTISRGQMNRQLYMGGGIMNAMPRQQYGLGSFVKKAVKKVTKGVKDIAKSDLGKAALGAAALYYMPKYGIKEMGGLPAFLQGAKTGIGNFLLGTPVGSDVGGNIRSGGLFSKLGAAVGIGEGGKGMGNLGKLATLGVVSTFLTKTLGMPPEQAEEEVARDPSKYLELYYRNLNPPTADTNSEQYEAQVRDFVTTNTSEYAEGGRIGYALGGNELPPDPTTPVNPFKPKPIGPVLPNKEMASNMENDKILEALFEKYLDMGLSPEKAAEKAREEFERMSMMKTEGRGLAALGGRMNYALGDTASQNAMQAAGIEGLPIRQNPKGVKELDLRDSGGFIPPVGIKEKEDDIPAMLSNNEFVFTADAVRGMGDGDVELGAQRMYDQMKMLEAGGKV